MGVIRKKTASRGTEAGTKFHCDVCSVDVTSTVSAKLLIAYNFEYLLEKILTLSSYFTTGPHFLCTPRLP